MFQEKISDYFDGVSAKYLSAVDARPEKSNQHEIGGLVKAGFDKFLGRPPKGEVTPFKARMAFLRDEEAVPIICEDQVSWYDSRHENRGPEYRLYYKSNDVTNALSEGDFFLVGKLHDGSLLLVFTPAGSTTEFQLRALFGIESVTDKFQAATLSASSLLLPLRLILEDIGLVLTHQTKDDETWLANLLSNFGNSNFPSTADFSAFARATIEKDIDPLTEPDNLIIGWMNHEERLFRILERHIVKTRLVQGFGEKGDDVDAFVSFSLSVQNRRKSRVGLAFENHLSCLFRKNNIHFEQGSNSNVTENKSKPDFLFPSFSAYRDLNYPTAFLRLLGAKTTCKDRWRQVLAEGSRITSKHLITLEAAISESQTSEMRASGLNLVVPSPIQSTYTKSQQAWLLSVSDFIDEVKHLQSN
jgi:hypothetical protein